MRSDTPALSYIEDLAISWQSGSHSAFEELYELFTSRVYRFVLVRIGNHEDAQDITSETWKTVFVYIPSYKRGNFRAFLFRIAYTQLIAHVRRNKKTSSLDEALEIKSKNVSFEDQLAQKEEIERVYQALNRLPEMYKEILLLRLMEGFSIVETAKILGKSSVMIRVTQHRAVKKVKELLT